MRKLLACLSSMLFVVLPPFAEVASAADKSKDDDRLRNCGTVLKEILDVPDNIPQDLLDKADCVVVFPSVLKAAFIVGGSYGRGVMSCRKGEDFRGPWGAPTMMALEGGSFGFQIGGEATDFVLLVMNEGGARGILGSKVKLGADASVAAGPVGRDTSAETDATLRAEILSYSRARGLFAGVSLEGSTIRPDNGDNRRLYGRKIPARDIVLSGTVAGASGSRAIDLDSGCQDPEAQAVTLDFVDAVRPMPDGKIGGVNHVDRSTCVAAALHVCGNGHTHPDHGGARDCSHPNRYFSEHQHSRCQHHLEL